MAAKSDKERADQEKREKQDRKREVAIGVAAEVGERIAVRRERKGLSQEQLADLADLDRSGISSIELGGSCPRMDTLIRIAGVLGCPVTELSEGLAWTPIPDAVGRGKLTIASEHGREGSQEEIPD